MLPNLSVLWVIFFILVLTFVVDRLLLKPVLGVIRRREDAIESARDSNTSDEELVGCLVAVLPTVGAARVISAAPKLGLALGYDVAAALEESGSPLV